jgi:hypothetical protein
MYHIPRKTQLNLKSALQGAALLLAAGALPAQAQPELFVDAVLVAHAAAPATTAAEPWDGRGSASEEFVNKVLLPQTAAVTAGPDQARQRRDDAASLFVRSVLQPQRGS